MRRWIELLDVTGTGLFVAHRSIGLIHDPVLVEADGSSRCAPPEWSPEPDQLHVRHAAEQRVEVATERDRAGAWDFRP